MFEISFDRFYPQLGEVLGLRNCLRTEYGLDFYLLDLFTIFHSFVVFLVGISSVNSINNGKFFLSGV